MNQTEERGVVWDRGQTQSIIKKSSPIWSPLKQEANSLSSSNYEKQKEPRQIYIREKDRNTTAY